MSDTPPLLPQELTVDCDEQRAEALSSLISTLVDHVVDIFHHRLLAFMEEVEDEETTFEFLLRDLSDLTGTLRRAQPPQSHPVFATRIPRELKPYAPKEKYPGIRDEYHSILSNLKDRMASLRRTLCLVLEQISEKITIISLVNRVHEALEIVMQDHFSGGHRRFENIRACLEAENLKTFLAPSSGNVINILSKDFSSTTSEERLMFAQYIKHHWMKPNGYTYKKIADEVCIKTPTVFRLINITVFSSHSPNSVALWNWLKEKVLASLERP